MSSETIHQRFAAAVLAASLAVTACSTAQSETVAQSAAASQSDAASQSQTAEVGLATESGFFDSSEVHDIAVEIDPADFEAAVSAYVATGDKEWIGATVTIDGVTYTQVGLRLKGNSSLRGVSSDDSPESLPWLIRLDKYVDDQNHEGLTDLVVRSNTSTTALNEAVALDLLEAAGLASQAAVSTSFSVNGSESVLRLTVELPDDVWMSTDLDSDGALYKAESTGDYTYRGDDPESYTDVFDQEAGKDNADLTPLIEFLDFINNSDDATFEAELGEHLDVESFATYLAMMDLVDNFDDIDGPGNNSYLYFDTASEQFTVVPWDLNLAFGATNGDGAGGIGGVGGPGVGGPPVGEVPAGGAGLERPERPAGAPVAGGNAAGGNAPGGDVAGGNVGGPAGSNVLAERFKSTSSFADLYAQALVDLKAELFDSGLAESFLQARVDLLSEHPELVDESTLTTEASGLAASIG